MYLRVHSFTDFVSLEAFNGRELLFHLVLNHLPIELFHIGVTPSNDEDLVPVALVQALLSEGLARIIHEVGLRADIVILRSYLPTGLTDAGQKAQILPLLPFATQYTPIDTPVGEEVCESIQIF